MCGIFGQINKSHKAHLDKPYFITSGMANDTRGGDSCGIFIDGNVEYGIDKTRLFSNFYESSELLKNTTECSIALGHCRKASVGAKTIAEAQPCVIRNNDKIEYVVIHNGTIFNYKELAAKYIPNVNITNMTDSQVLTQIFYYTGFDVLSEYIGAAAFVAVDYRGDTPKIYFWRGASKTYSNSKEDTEERPLYLYKTETSLLFSSLGNWLKAFTGFNEVMVFSKNCLVTLNDKFNLVVVKEFDRSNCTQCMPIVQTCFDDPFENYNDYGRYYDGYYNNYYRGYSSIKHKHNDTDQKIKMNNVGLFNKNGEVLNGLHYLALDGSESKAQTIYPCYFIEGYLLKNKDCYEFLTKFTQSCNLSLSDLPTCIPETLEYLSMFPSIIGKLDNDPYIYYYKDPSNTEPFTGKLQIFGSKDIFLVEDGSIITTIQPTTYDTLYNIYKESTNFKINTEAVYKRISEECENII